MSSFFQKVFPYINRIFESKYCCSFQNQHFFSLRVKNKHQITLFICHLGTQRPWLNFLILSKLSKIISHQEVRVDISLTYSGHEVKRVNPKVLQMINFNLFFFSVSLVQNFRILINNAKSKISIRTLSNVWFSKIYATSNTVFPANFQISRIS